MYLNLMLLVQNYTQTVEIGIHFKSIQLKFKAVGNARLPNCLWRKQACLLTIITINLWYKLCYALFPQDSYGIYSLSLTELSLLQPVLLQQRLFPFTTGIFHLAIFHSQRMHILLQSRLSHSSFCRQHKNSFI